MSLSLSFVVDGIVGDFPDVPDALFRSGPESVSVLGPGLAAGDRPPTGPYLEILNAHGDFSGGLPAILVTNLSARALSDQTEPI